MVTDVTGTLNPLSETINLGDMTVSEVLESTCELAAILSDMGREEMATDFLTILTLIPAAKELFFQIPRIAPDDLDERKEQLRKVVEEAKRQDRQNRH
jgi:hypothetical protein